MKKINNSIKDVKDLDYKLKLSYSNAMKDSNFKSFVDSINLSDDKLMKHTSLLEDSCKEFYNCKNCKGLLSARII